MRDHIAPYYWLRDYGVEVGHEETGTDYVKVMADEMDEVD